jgi:predicted O-methyltransferase YrrM
MGCVMTVIDRQTGPERARTGASDLQAALERLDIGPRDRSQISDEEAAFLFRFMREHELADTLEVGCGLGKSAVSIMLGTGGEHLAIDPFQANYDFRGVGNVERAGLAESFELRAERSCTALPALLAEGRRFDFVFIDGSHRFDDILLDFTFADLLLRPGGYVVFDDLWMRTTQLVLAYIRTNRPDYRRDPSAPHTLALVQKVGKDTRNGMFHREFYTPRGFVSHHAVTWLAGPDTRAKRVARRLKSALYR